MRTELTPEAEALTSRYRELLSLPDYIVSEGERTGTANIICPRRECGNKFIVNLIKWVRGTGGRRFVGRSCPYCFRTSGVPREHWDKQMENEFGMERDSLEEREEQTHGRKRRK
jgi:hypothetical protein